MHVLFSPSQDLWHTRQRSPYTPKGAVTSQVPYVTSEQISALLGNIHPILEQKQTYIKTGNHLQKQRAVQAFLMSIFM